MVLAYKKILLFYADCTSPDIDRFPAANNNFSFADAGHVLVAFLILAVKGAPGFANGTSVFL